MADAPGRFTDNPFFVLGVTPEQTRAEIEREGAKLLGMLELGLRSATSYPTPTGTGTRTPEAVRAALAELRDPERRLLHELWASAPPPQPKAADEGAAERSTASAGDPYRGGDPERGASVSSKAQPGFAEAFSLFGWGRL